MRQILFLCVFFFLMLCSPVLAQEGQTEAAAGVTGDVVEEPLIEIIVLEDGNEEVQEILPDSAYSTGPADEGYLAMKIDARQRINILLEQIRELENKNEEAELQKQIEQIKTDAEIERLTLLKTAAESHEDYDLADELANEIDHLERIDQPIIGSPAEQQPQQTIE